MQRKVRPVSGFRSYTDSQNATEYQTISITIKNFILIFGIGTLKCEIFTKLHTEIMRDFLHFLKSSQMNLPAKLDHPLVDL